MASGTLEVAGHARADALLHPHRREDDDGERDAAVRAEVHPQEGVAQRDGVLDVRDVVQPVREVDHRLGRGSQRDQDHLVERDEDGELDQLGP